MIYSALINHIYEHANNIASTYVPEYQEEFINYEEKEKVSRLEDKK